MGNPAAEICAHLKMNYNNKYSKLSFVWR